MILNKKINIKIRNNKIRQYYNKIGYDTSQNDILIDIEHLIPSSHYKINVKCDICGTEKTLKYYNYIKNISKHNIYTCNNICAQIKNKITSLEKFGVEHHSKTIEHRAIV